MALLKEYMKVRAISTAKFVFCQSTGGRDTSLTRDCVRTICVEHMERAGIDTGVYKAHSIRHAAASALVKANIPLDVILKLGRWKTLSTFVKYYLRTDTVVNVARVLQNGNTVTEGLGTTNTDMALLIKEASNTKQFQVKNKGASTYRGRGRPRLTDKPFTKKKKKKKKKKSTLR
eukprot:TRINITY_DN11560_c0_g1_i1.p1 TRINITY_DN11560_c0_g1~~TRINITY_DN11560_c0_g1_i1.p1  ORF type:complete len:175 (+),score=32.43 TRINITY_DN11560_c0_g1_i1:532-1056(+)